MFIYSTYNREKNDSHYRGPSINHFFSFPGMKYSVLLFGTTPAWRSPFNNNIHGVLHCDDVCIYTNSRTGCIGSVPALCLFNYYSLEALIIFRIIISHYHNGHKYLTLPPQSTQRIIIQHSVFFCVRAVRGRTDRIGGLLGTTGKYSLHYHYHPNTYSYSVIRHGIV